MIISVANSRMEKRWKRRELSWEELKEQLSHTIRTAETVAEYKAKSKSEQDNIKDVGGFVGGALREGKRKNGYVESRCLLTLDMDYATQTIWDEITMFFDYKCLIYSTHKSTEDKPRLRLIIPFSHEVTADEYPAVARMVAKGIGMELFDDTTYQPERMMYFPSTSSDGVYTFESQDGPELNPDDILSRYKDWRDTSSWPVSSRQAEVVKRSMAKQADPLEKDGIVGAFCRTYPMTSAIETFLSDVYQPSVMEGRYDYLKADSTAGVVIYDDKFAFSHHATDLACNGHVHNAFDLVLIHKFAHLDDKAKADTNPTCLPSYQAMCEFALRDESVKLLIAEEKQQAVIQEFAEGNKEWKKYLEYEKKSTVLKNCLFNLRLILENDEKLKEIRYNRLANQIYAKELPWERPHQSWRDADIAQLVSYVDSNYGTFSARNYEIALTKVADDRAYHPIREYLDKLPAWDGVARVDNLLITYFGAEDNEYTRLVTRKFLCAAVARIYHPGIKFDSMLVLNGKTDLGKSTFFARLAGEWFSDSLNFTDMGKSKDASEKIQGVWIIEIPEMAGLSKMDVNNIKGFLSRQDDQYRPSYGRTVESHPRQCVIVGSTNAESAGFLKDTTGNRRFWVVRVEDKGNRGWDLPEVDVVQIWAEAKQYYVAGEKLYLEGDVVEKAKEEQTMALEADEREGIVLEYLDMLVPENWYDMSIYERRNYLLDGDDNVMKPVGTMKRDFISNIEIWCECFGNDRSKLDKQSDSYKIKQIMQKIGGWKFANRKNRIKGYGPQFIWEREV